MSEPLKMTDEVIALINVVTPMDVETLGAFGTALQAVVDVEVAKAKAEAWTEGHNHPWKRDRDDGCVCGAWNSGECACGMYGTGELLSLVDNPYAESGGQS